MNTQSDKVRSFFDDTEQYLRDNIVIGLRVRYLKSILGQLKGKKILDAGCGDGTLSNFLAGENELTLMDISAEMLKVAKAKMPESAGDKVQYVQGNIETMSPEGNYDLIILVGVAAHLNNVEATLLKIRDRLNTGGRFIFQFTDYSHPVSFLNRLKKKFRGGVKYNYEVQKTKNSEILKILKRQGWTVTKEYRYFPVSPFFSVFPAGMRPSIMQFFHRKLGIISGLGPEIIFELSYK